LELTELQPGEDPTPWLREFLEIEAKGWKGESGVAAAQHPAERTYIEEMTARAHRRGRLMMMALRLDGKAIALKHNLLAGEVVLALVPLFQFLRARLRRPKRRNS